MKNDKIENVHKKSVKREKKYNKNELTDNVKFNEMLAPYYWMVMVLALNSLFKIPLIEPFFSSSVFYAFISTAFYVFVTNYYQPDLDIKANRPGMGHFPLGRWAGSFKFGRFIKWFIYPVNRAWYWMWHPYGQLLTHRGAGHWPIWGVWIRTWYLLLWVMGINWLFKTDSAYVIAVYIGICIAWLLRRFYKKTMEGKGVGLRLFSFGGISYWIKSWLIITIPFAVIIALKITNSTVNISFLEDLLKSFFPWNKNFGNFYFILFCFPIYLSDTVHIAVDYYDAVKRGMSFCPPRIPRGLLIKTLNTIRGVR